MLIKFKVTFAGAISTLAYRPIQGYRRHISKGAKPLGRARGQTYSAARKQAVLCLLLPSFIDFFNIERF